MSKTIKYIVAIAVLLGLNLTLLFSGKSSNSASFDHKLFTVQDTTAISTVSIKTENEEVVLKRTLEGWVLNETYPVDQSFLKILFSILNKVEVKRHLGEMSNEGAGSVKVGFDSGESRSFEFSSDAIGTQSYFIEDGVGYQVEVPGYRDNIVNIFELNEDQWRNRLVFDGSWRTIQKLTLTSLQDNFEISFNGQFFNVTDVVTIDSSMVVDYLNQFQLFQANEMISKGRFSELDQMQGQEPLAVLRIDDIQTSEETIFTIYPNAPGQSYHLVTKNNQEMMVFDGQRIQALLRSSSDFAAK